MGILNDRELASLDRLYFEESHAEEAIQVCTCGRALDNIGELAGVPANAWRAKPITMGVIVRGKGATSREAVSIRAMGGRPWRRSLRAPVFGDPERLTGVYRARPAQRGKVRAGDVLREESGAVWLAGKPSEYGSGRPGVRANLELVPGAMVPSSLRAGILVRAGAVTQSVYAAIRADSLTVTADVSAAPVPSWCRVLGFSSRGNLAPGAITISDVGKLISFTFPAGTDPLDPALDWITFAY